jgi:hypothetical protein
MQSIESQDLASIDAIIALDQDARRQASYIIEHHMIQSRGGNYA